MHFTRVGDLATEDRNKQHSNLIEVNQANSLPGRLGSKGVFRADFGTMNIYFYMTKEKVELARQMIYDVNENMVHAIITSELDYPVIEASPLATKCPDPLAYDSQGHPVYADPQGTQILQEHATKVKTIMEQVFDFKLKACSHNMSLIVNQDAMKYHQDQLQREYQYIAEHPKPIPKYTLVQDLTIFDWQMYEGTLSATVIQPPHTQDRYLVVLFPQEVVGAVYTEPAIYVDPHTPPEYPGAKTLPPHTPIAPIDLYPDVSPGSDKGKRLSVVVRGVVPTEEMNKIQEETPSLPMNLPVASEDSQGAKCYSYQNGILIRALPESIPHLETKWKYKLPDSQGVEIQMTKPNQNPNYVQAIMKMFQIECPLEQVIVRHLTKKEGGFSRLDLMDLGYDDESQVVIVNRSEMPEKYHYLNLADMSFEKGLPWIQLYNLPPQMALLATKEALKHMALTSVEEVLYRDPFYDISLKEASVLNKKIVSRFDLFIFKKYKQI